MARTPPAARYHRGDLPTNDPCRARRHHARHSCWDHRDALAVQRPRARIIGRSRSRRHAGPRRQARRQEKRGASASMRRAASTRIHKIPSPRGSPAIMTATRSAGCRSYRRRHARRDHEREQSMGHFCDSRASLVACTHTMSRRPICASARRHRVHERCGHDRRRQFGDRHDQGRTAAAFTGYSSSRFGRLLARRRSAPSPSRPNRQPALRRVGAVRLGGCLDQAAPPSGVSFRRPHFIFVPRHPINLAISI